MILGSKRRAIGLEFTLKGLAGRCFFSLAPIPVTLMREAGAGGAREDAAELRENWYEEGIFKPKCQ